MDTEKSLVKITTKYHCMVSGKKQMEPCDGCTNPQGCLSKAMQYKENEEMDELNEKAIVKLDADGAVVKCAKGLEATECGYKAGAKVCGACGAMASMTKADMMPDAEEDEEEMSDDDTSMMPDKKKKGGMGGYAMGEDDEEEMMPAKKKGGMPDAEEDEEDEEEMMPAKKKGGMGEYAEEDEEEMMPVKKRGMPMVDAEMVDEEEVMPMPKKKKPMMMADDEEEMPEDEEGMGKTWMMKPSKRSRMMAMKSLEVKSDNDDVYMCQLERKSYPSASQICENCPGGCQTEGGMPGLLDVEGVGLGIIGGKVLDSGYSFDDDLFVVQLQAKDGNTWEMIADGQSGEMLRMERIKTPDFGIEGKSAFDEETASEFGIVSASEAVEIALKSLESEFDVIGDVVSTDSDVFLGHDVYSIEVDAMNGKSYDVYVSLDGQFVGLDEWTADEAEEIEAEAAEIALKRAYNEESRTDMAKGGMAMPDGSYPIKDVADLRNAIQAYGRAKDKEATKAHIIKRAMALGSEDLIPENWVPKDIKDKFSSEKSEDSQFMASLMEFELLAQEENLKDIL